MGSRDVSRSDWGGALNYPFQTMQQEMNRMFADFLNVAPMGWLSTDRWLAGSDFFTPRIDVTESDKAYEVTVELPGSREEDFDISIDNGMLTIEGEKKMEREDKGRTYHRLERASGTFRRTVALPSGAEEDKISAGYDNGVLTVTVPLKASKESRAKKIPVKAH